MFDKHEAQMPKKIQKKVQISARISGQKLEVYISHAINAMRAACEAMAVCLLTMAGHYFASPTTNQLKSSFKKYPNQYKMPGLLHPFKSK
jgi:hypothetical protein